METALHAALVVGLLVQAFRIEKLAYDVELLKLKTQGPIEFKVQNTPEEKK